MRKSNVRSENGKADRKRNRHEQANMEAGMIEQVSGVRVPIGLGSWGCLNKLLEEWGVVNNYQKSGLGAEGLGAGGA